VIFESYQRVGVIKVAYLISYLECRS